MSSSGNNGGPAADTDPVRTPTGDETQNGVPSTLPASEVNHNLAMTTPISGQSKKSNERDYLLQTKVPDEVMTVVTSQEKMVEAAFDGHPNDDRETWGKKIDFLLSIIGFAVDLANVWRFPYFCYKNGGGAFLIPYFSMLIFGAIPLFMMELALGQFHRQGAVSVWKIAPIFKGIGICQCVIAYIVSFYYNVIIAWSVYYLISSFTSTLPWMSCNNPWNTENCTEFHSYNATAIGSNLTNAAHNITNGTSLQSVSAAAEFFERRVLGLHESEGLHDLGAPRWQMVLCLLAVFTMLYLSLWKGVKSSGKVVWVTATLPYVVLAILLFRGVFLPGSREGVLFFITPDLSRLLDAQVWIDAAIQIFYSVGAGFGVHMAFASYNKFNNNIYRDCLTTVAINSFTSLFSGFVIFCYLGYMANKMGRHIKDVATEGPGLVFVVYPEAIATLPGSVGWSILFFIMLITLGLDSAMGGLEAVLTGLRDETRHILVKYRYGREILTLVVCLSSFLLSLMNITNGGMYMFTIWDTFAAGTSILFGVFSLAVAIGWFYGIDQFCDDFQKMMKFRPNLYWRICWKFISPVFIFVIVVSSIVSYRPLVYQSYTIGNYVYPRWANGVGWFIGACSMVCIPGWAIFYLIKTPGPLSKRVAMGISPESEHRTIQKGEQVSRYQKRHWLSV